MSSDIWLCLNVDERALLREALLAHLVNNRRKVGNLLKKLDRASVLPETTLRVECGFVDIEGNPNIIRMYDYDCDGCDGQGTDERARACIISEYEPQFRTLS